MPTRLFQQKVILFPLIISHFWRDALRPGTYPVLCHTLTHWLILATSDVGRGNKAFVVVQSLSCLTFCNLMDWSMSDSSVLHYLSGFTQIHVHWVGDAIQPSHPLLPSSPSAFNLQPASGSFPVSQFFTSGGQSTGVSASTSVLPMNSQNWFPLEWTGLISLQSKGLSRVFSSTTVQKHQFFSAQPSLWSNSHPYMTAGKTIALTICTCVGKVMSLLFKCCLGLS